MKKKSLKTNIIFFLLGVLVWFLIGLIWDWEGNVKSFIEGYKGARETEREAIK